jgi:hypothetical protein
VPEVDPFGILIGTVAAFVLGGAYYALLGDRLATVSEAAASGGQTSLGEVGIELLRCLVLVTVVAGLAAEASIDDPGGGLLLGLALWAGFPLVLWIGAVVHERTPVKLAAIHGGDWLVKLLAVGVLVAALQ